MNTLHLFGVTWVMQVTGIAIVAMILGMVFRRQAALRHAISLTALLLILVAPVLVAVLPAPNWWKAFQDSPSESVAAVDAPSVAASPARTVKNLRAETNLRAVDDRPFDDIAKIDTVPKESHVSTPLDNSDMELDRLAVQQSLTTAPFGWENWLQYALEVVGVVWIIGIVAFALRFAWLRRNVQQMTRSLNRAALASNALPFELAKALSEAAAAVGLRHLPAVAISDVMPMPMVVGLRHSILVLPADLLTGSPGRLRDVLVHECAHLVRRDPWSNAAQKFAAILYWFHPVVHWLNRQIACSREEVCDNYVLRQGDSADYAQTLLELAERCAAERTTLPALGILTTRWTLEDRIAGLLNPARNTTTRTRSTSIAAIAVLFCLLPPIVGGVRAVDKQSSKSEVTSAEEQGAVPANTETSRTELSKPDTKSATEAASANPNNVAMKKIAIRGKCVDRESKFKPVADVRIRIFRYPSRLDAPMLVAESRTSGDGLFAFQDIETVVDKAPFYGAADVWLAATGDGFTSNIRSLDGKANDIDLSLEMSDRPCALTGVVTDNTGQPVPGVTVYIFSQGAIPLPGIQSAVTDAKGRYAISDLARWEQKEQYYDPETGSMTGHTRCSFFLAHPDFALTRSQYSEIPSEVNVTLQPPAVIEGRVIDIVTGNPVTNVVVNAQGIVDSGWYEARTDGEGKYRLSMTQDHYNIWTEMDDRIAVAVKAIEAQSGGTTTGADIRLVRGGFVTGTAFDATTGKAVTPTKSSYQVAHYGPARPHSGAAVTATDVKADGTYRLRVAPGRNYVYTMFGNAAAYVDVKENEEVRLDLHLGADFSNEARRALLEQDEDYRLGQRLQTEARNRKMILTELSGKGDGRRNRDLNSRQRIPTDTGRLLDKLEKQQMVDIIFTDEWCRTLKAIVDLGSDAVPDLIAELDATDSGRMLRSVAFMLRAIGDTRAVPALIRAIPKTFLPPGSDMGCSGKDVELVKFMQRHDLEENDEDGEYGIGKPVRELFGTLTKLTGQKFDEEELFNVDRALLASQQPLQRAFYFRTAKKWANWWEQNWQKHVDLAYSRVSLIMPDAAPEKSSFKAGTQFKMGNSGVSFELHSVLDPKAETVFYDLDTGRQAGLPEKWRNAKDLGTHLDEIIAWAAGEGFDMMGDDYHPPTIRASTPALRSIGMQVWQLFPKQVPDDNSEFTLESLKEAGTPVGEFLLFTDPKTKDVLPLVGTAFFCITREGTPVFVDTGSGRGPKVSLLWDEKNVPKQPVARGTHFGWMWLQEANAGSNSNNR